MHQKIMKLVLVPLSTFFCVEVSFAQSIKDQMRDSVAVKNAIEELVLANHILYEQNAVDGYGHISVRNPNNPNTFFLARSIAPSVVQVDDIIEFDMDGKPLNGDQRAIYGERFIHSGIYRVRTDVNSVVHGHAAPVLPFALTGTKLKPVYHMAAFLGDGAPIFEIRQFAKPSPDTDMFVSSNDLGEALARVAGTHDFVLMRGHGYATTANSIRLAVFRTVYAIQNALIQAEAMKMGQTQYLTQEETIKSQGTIEKTMNRPWELWSSKLSDKK